MASSPSCILLRYQVDEEATCLSPTLRFPLSPPREAFPDNITGGAGVPIVRDPSAALEKNGAAEQDCFGDGLLTSRGRSWEESPEDEVGASQEMAWRAAWGWSGRGGRNDPVVRWGCCRMPVLVPPSGTPTNCHHTSVELQRCSSSAVPRGRQPPDLVLHVEPTRTYTPRLNYMPFALLWPGWVRGERSAPGSDDVVPLDHAPCPSWNEHGDRVSVE